MEKNNQTLLIRQKKLLFLALVCVGAYFFFFHALIPHLKYQKLRVQVKAKTRTLNQLRPSMKGLSEFVQNPLNVSSDEIRNYLNYFKKVSDFKTNRADAWGMRGFCSFYLGQTKDAVFAYERAIKLNPDFFWYYYNLGMILFKNGETQKAVSLWRKALTVKPKQTIKFIVDSREIYLPMLLSRESEPEIVLQQQLTKAYQTINLLSQPNVLKENSNQFQLEGY